METRLPLGVLSLALSIISNNKPFGARAVIAAEGAPKSVYYNLCRFELSSRLASFPGVFQDEARVLRAMLSLRDFLLPAQSSRVDDDA